MKQLVLAALLVGLAVVAGSAAEQRDRTLPPAASGRIVGTVVAADSGRPIRFASVLLTSSTSEVSMVTGDDGTFSFDGLTAGPYRLQVAKGGYLETAYGQLRPGTDTRGKRIVLTDREVVERLVIPLSHGGSISGVVRDDRGDPVYHATVRVSRRVMRNGTRTLETVDSAETDERGRYRISLLPPREYIVSVLPTGGSIPSAADEKKTPPAGFAPLFYPSSLSARGAEILPLGLGEDRSGIDLELKTVRLGRVTGLVLGADGRPVPDMPVVLTDPEHSDVDQGGGTDQQGRFVFDHLAPGSYVIYAGLRSHSRIVFDRKSDIALYYESEMAKTKVVTGTLTIDTRSLRSDVPFNAEPEMSRGTAIADVSVTSGVDTETTLTLVTPRVVRGRVVLSGAGQRPSLQNLHVVLSSDEYQTESSARTAADGTFELPNVTPGKWQVSISELPGWVLSSAISAGSDVLDNPLDVPRDRDVRDLALTLTDRITEVSGTVMDALSKPVAEGMVILFPVEERLWAQGARRIHSNVLSDDGRFRFEQLRPGAYRLALAESVEPDEWLDPQFLKKLLAISVPVTVQAGDRKVQDLRVK